MWREGGGERITDEVTGIKVYGSEVDSSDNTADVSLWHVLALKHTISPLPSPPLHSSLRCVTTRPLRFISNWPENVSGLSSEKRGSAPVSSDGSPKHAGQGCSDCLLFYWTQVCYFSAYLLHTLSPTAALFPSGPFTAFLLPSLMHN